MKRKYIYKLGVNDGLYLRYSITSRKNGLTYEFYTEKYSNGGLFMQQADGTFKQQLGIYDFDMNVSESTQRRFLLKNYKYLELLMRKEELVTCRF